MDKRCSTSENQHWQDQWHKEAGTDETHRNPRLPPIAKQEEQEMKTAFDYKDQPSIWLTDTKMKRFKQGEEYAKKKQDSRDINDKNQVFIYSKALSRKK